MATIENPKTRTALRKIGCLVEDQLDRVAFTSLLAQHMEANHIAASLEEVTTVETTVGQLVNAIVGRSDEQLVEVVKPLLAPNAKGPVQLALSNGFLLCANRVRIDVNLDGEHRTTTIGTRFLSSDHDVLDRYVFEPRLRRGESFVNRTLELTTLIDQRQPGMAPRIGSFIDQLNVTWQKALLATNKEEDK